MLSSATGITCSRWARYDTARKLDPSVAPIHISVVWAFFHSGFRKAGTPLEMASTPVTAAPPEAKALSTTNNAMAATPGLRPPCCTWLAMEKGFRCPVRTSYMPRPHVRNRLPMNT